MPAQKRFKTSYPGVFFIKGTAVASGKEERIYYVLYRKNGKLIEEKAGRQFQDDMTPAKASRIRVARINGDELPNKERRKEQTEQEELELNRWTVNRLFDEFIKHKAYLKSLRDDKSRYENHIRERFGEKELSELSPFDMDKLRITLLKNHKPATVKQVLVLFLRIVNFGVSKQLCPPLPFKVEMPKVNNQKTEDLSPAQLHRLLDVIADHPDKQATHIMLLALYTGMRRTEMLRLKWEHIDFDRGFIRIVNPKGGKDQVIPLNDSVRQLFNEHPKTDSPYVFPGKYGGERNNIAKALKKIKDKAGLPDDFRPLHGLRHVFASTLASSGQVDLYTLQKLLTHKSPQMTQRYAHLRDDALKRASNLAGELIQKATEQAGKDSTEQSA